MTETKSGGLGEFLERSDWVTWILAVLIVGIFSFFVDLRTIFEWARDTGRPSDAEGFWAFVGALLNVLVLAVAIRGLNALKLTRIGIQTQAMRDSRDCAIARCEEFGQEIMTLYDPVAVSFMGQKTPVFVQNADEVQFVDPGEEDRSEETKHLERAQQWFSKLPAETRGDCIRLLNRLEAWAMYFTHGLAAGPVASGPCASFYCSIVVQQYPVLVVLRDEETSGNYPNLVKLYLAWLEELESHKRGLKEGQMLKELAEMQSKGTHKHKLSEPLGTQIPIY